MTSKKRQTTKKLHPIDDEHSKTGKKSTDNFAQNTFNNHSGNTQTHINAHATFSPRTTLSQGRGK